VTPPSRHKFEVSMNPALPRVEERFPREFAYTRFWALFTHNRFSVYRSVNW